MIFIPVKNLNDDTIEEQDFDNLPAICPHCGIGVDFKPIHAVENDTAIFLMAECPNCRFMSLFTATLNSYNFTNLIPCKQPVRLSTNLQELSPMFCKVYEQTKYAKDYNLDELAGVGFGKAIEHLVDDYIIKVQNETPKGKFFEKIKMLKNFNDATISLSLARVIRNDETHPEKRSEFSLTDLIEAVEYIKIFFDAKYATFKMEQKLNLNKTNNAVV